MPGLLPLVSVIILWFLYRSQNQLLAVKLQLASSVCEELNALLFVLISCEKKSDIFWKEGVEEIGVIGSSEPIAFSLSLGRDD